MEKVHPWCGQPSDRGRLKEQKFHRKHLKQQFLAITETLDSGIVR